MAKKPTCKLIGEDSNIFNLMGKASKVLKDAGMHDKANEMTNKVFDSTSYEQALSIIGEYVKIV